jgi:hypothetical protein
MIAATGQARSVDAVHEPAASVTARIRRGLRAVFAQWGLPAEVAESALLVVEELVANVVDHAPPRSASPWTTAGRLCTSPCVTGARARCASARPARTPDAAGAWP